MTDVKIEEFNETRTKFLADLNSVVNAKTDPEIQNSSWHLFEVFMTLLDYDDYYQI